MILNDKTLILVEEKNDSITGICVKIYRFGNFSIRVETDNRGKMPVYYFIENKSVPELEFVCVGDEMPVLRINSFFASGPKEIKKLRKELQDAEKIFGCLKRL